MGAVSDAAPDLDESGPESGSSPAPSGAWQLESFARSLLAKSPATTRAYAADLAAFARWAERGGHDSPDAVKRLVLRRYLAYLGTRRYARASIARKAAALRAYFGWCRRHGIVTEDPARQLSAPRTASRLPRVLSSGEVTSLLDAPTGTPLDRRDVAVLELLYAAGLRVSELCGLDRGDIDLRGRTVTVLGKGSKQRRVPIHDAAVDVGRKAEVVGIHDQSFGGAQKIASLMRRNFFGLARISFARPWNCCMASFMVLYNCGFTSNCPTVPCPELIWSMVVSSLAASVLNWL